MLKLKQAFLTSQVQGNVVNSLTELLVINSKIANWYKKKVRQNITNVKVQGSGS